MFNVTSHYQMLTDDHNLFLNVLQTVNDFDLYNNNLVQGLKWNDL